MRQDGRLDCGAVSHSLVRVDGAVGLLAVEELLQQLADLGDPGGAADEDHLVDLVLGESGVLKHAFHRRNALLEIGQTQFFELGPRDETVEVGAVG